MRSSLEHLSSRTLSLEHPAVAAAGCPFGAFFACRWSGVNRTDATGRNAYYIGRGLDQGSASPSPATGPRAPDTGRPFHWAIQASCYSSASTFATSSSSVWSRSVRVLTFTVVKMRGAAHGVHGRMAGLDRFEDKPTRLRFRCRWGVAGSWAVVQQDPRAQSGSAEGDVERHHEREPNQGRERDHR